MHVSFPFFTSAGTSLQLFVSTGSPFHRSQQYRLHASQALLGTNTPLLSPHDNSSVFSAHDKFDMQHAPSGHACSHVLPSDHRSSDPVQLSNVVCLHSNPFLQHAPNGLSVHGALRHAASVAYPVSSVPCLYDGHLPSTERVTLEHVPAGRQQYFLGGATHFPESLHAC